VVIGDFSEDFKIDPLKTIFKVKGLTGHELSELLDKMRINIEKSTEKAVVVTVHINITEEDVD
jgi:arginine/lysine/ornithine decarboxylase